MELSTSVHELSENEFMKLLAKFATLSLSLVSNANGLRFRPLSAWFQGARLKCSSFSSSTITNESEMFPNVSTALPIFTKLDETLAYKGYRSVIRKRIILPDTGKNVGKIAEFDITSQGSASVFVFSWNTTSCTTTLLQEYAPGIERFQFGVVAGVVETGNGKHESIKQAAEFELEEEAHFQMKNKQNWIPLLGSDSDCSRDSDSNTDTDSGTTMVAMAADKYSDNLYYQYLVLNPTIVDNPKPLDDDEVIIIHRDVTVKQLMAIIRSGQMSSTSTTAALLALEKLRDLGLPLHPQEKNK